MKAGGLRNRMANKNQSFVYSHKSLGHHFSRHEILQCEGEGRDPQVKDGTKANVAAIKVGQFLMMVNFIAKMRIINDNFPHLKVAVVCFKICHKFANFYDCIQFFMYSIG